jgi:hypothetical protein
MLRIVQSGSGPILESSKDPPGNTPASYGSRNNVNAATADVAAVRTAIRDRLTGASVHRIVDVPPELNRSLNVCNGWKAGIAGRPPFSHYLRVDIDALVPDLWRRYPFLEDESLRVRLGGIKESDVAFWSSEYGGDRQTVYVAFARYLAIAFHERRLPFAFCDAVMNDLQTIIAMADEPHPDLFWQVYLAFDAGEYHRREDKSDDPVAEHTEPAIADIAKSL